VRRGVAALTVAVAGLVLAGATSATWVTEERIRDVGGVQVTEIVTTPGTALAPVAVALGVLAAVSALAFAPTRGAVRRGVGVVIAVIGVVALAVVGVGIARAAQLEGSLGAAPWLAVTGAAVVVAAGLMGTLRPDSAPMLGARFSVDDAADGDAEWRLAMGEDEPDARPE
jgi:hypothetical protein